MGKSRNMFRLELIIAQTILKRVPKAEDNSHITKSLSRNKASQMHIKLLLIINESKEEMY